MLDQTLKTRPNTLGAISSWAAGDWAICSTLGVWEKVVNAGATNLDALSDVAISAPANSQLVKYSGGQWLNSLLSLNELSNIDMTTTPPTNGNILSYNFSAAKWVPVTLPNCSAGQVLKSDGVSFSCVTDNAGAGSFSGANNRVVTTDGAGVLATSAVSNTELGYLSGATSSLQNQITNISASMANKADGTNVAQNITASTLTASTVTGLNAPLIASDAANKAYVDTFWTIASGNIYRSSGNVGIGTSTPATLLNTYGSNATLYTAGAGRYPLGTQITTINSSSTAGTMSGINFIATNAGNVQQNAHIGAVSTAAGYSPALVFGAASGTANYVERMRIDSGGNVGIGTTTPRTKFDVSGDISIGSASGATGTANQVFYGDNNSVNTKLASMKFVRSNYDPSGVGAEISFYRTSGGQEGELRFATNPGSAAGQTPTDRMTISPVGNVGIGTTIPLTTLNINAGGGVNLRNESGTGKTIHALLTGTADSVSGGALHPTLQISSAPLGILGMYTGEVFFTKRSGLTYADYGSGVRGLVTSVADARHNGLAFFTSSHTNINGDAMVIDHLGNVGVGTNAPLGAMDLVRSGGYSTFRIRTNTTTNVIESALNFQKNHSLIEGVHGATVDTENLGQIGWNGNTGSAFAQGAFIYGVQNGSAGASFIPTDIKFSTSDGTAGAAARMIVKSNGNVGIGTTNPGQKLQVGDFTASTENMIKITGNKNNADGDVPFADLWMSNEGNSGGGVKLQSSHYIDNYGAKLDILIGKPLSDGGASGNLTSIMTLLGTGKVGIGTNAPSVDLEVKTPLVGGSPGLRIANDTTSTGNPYVEMYRNTADAAQLLLNPGGSTTGGLYLRTTHSSGNIIFQTVSSYGGLGSNERMRISSTGNVGIGTNTPSAPLSVSTTAVSGNIATFVSTGSGGAGCSIAWNGTSCSSDLRLKENIESLSGADILDDLLRVQPVSFNWKKDQEKKKQIGFIAQQLEKYFPEFVTTDSKGLKQVNYANFVAVVTASLQEFYHSWSKDSEVLHTEIDSLKKENKDLKEAVCSMNPKLKICVVNKK
jgi:hypothetical protein